MSYRVTLLGCGSSGGVPRVGEGFGTCDPAEPRNRRRRCSILVETENASGRTSVLVDTSPDLREQLIDAGINALDGVLYTHDHADHTHGIDDLRGLAQSSRRKVDTHADERTAAVLHARFGYCFSTPPGSAYPPILNDCRLVAGTWVEIEGAGGSIAALPFTVGHGDIDALGFRFGNLAYTPDVKSVPDESLEALANLDVWIVDALRRRPHPSHWHLDLTLEWIARLKPRRAILTNLHTDMDYQTLCAELPDGIEPGYDGMVISSH
jgi:phosphoribosyl 1,2-cyclic phosphate phosphodiesterase